MCSGGRLVIFSTEESMSGRAIKHHNLDCIKIVPTHWKLLALSEGIFTPNTTLIFGGESIGEDVLDLLRKNSISCIIYNHYGPTETTIGKLIYKINIHEKDKLLPLGRPFGNNEVYLLNGQGDFVPVGAIGEIYIGGVGLSLGYLHDAKLTKEKFVKAKWDDSLILYKTGDYGRWLNDKNLFFEGRKDAQVKIRGNRVELPEITRRLEELEYIDQAVLLPFMDLESQIEIYAFLISKYKLQKEIILEYLSEYLPSYMIPKELIFVEKIPLLANGKLDVKSLKQLAVDLEVKTFKIESLTTCTEIELAKIWSKVLNINLDNIGKKEHFFNLGGHSLKVAQLVNEVNKKFNKNIEFYEIFETPVLEEQAKLIFDSHSVKYIPIGKTSEKEMYRISASQRRIWLVCQNPAAGSMYNIPKFYEFADLNIEKFKKAVNLVVNRHEILRTIFKEVQHETDVMQIILNMNDITIVVNEIDLRGNDDPYVQVLDKINIDAKTQFDLEEFPLFVLNLYRIADKNHILSFVIHHIISDAWSAQNVMKEFLLAYNAFLKNEEPNLSNIEIQYKDFSEWQHDQLDTGKLNNQKTFWLDLFDDLPEKTVLPHQSTFDALKTYHGSQENFSIDVKILNQFNKRLAKSDHSTFTGILALMSILLKRYTNSDKIIFGIPIPGRTKEELHNSVGMFVNLLPIKIDFKPEDTFQDLVDQVQRYLSLAMQNQDYPYDSLIDELNSLNNACNSLFEIMVTYNDLKDTKSSNNTDILGFNTSSQLNRKYGGNGTSKYDISFNFSDSDDGLILRIEYNSDLFDRVFILTFFDHFLGLFNSLLKNPQSLINNLEMLADQELKELLRIGSTDEYKFIESNVIELFYHNFLDKKNLLAYASGKVKYTYSQIDEVSNKGAIYLQNYFEGKKGNIIAVLLQNKDERSIFSILSILKSGNTYLPIDPNVSGDRRNFILTNSNCKYIIDENSFEEMFSIVEEEIPLMKINSSDIAYILYTSGTTGTPKGVKISHQSLFKTIRGHLNMMSLEPGMRMTQFFPLTFDPSLLEIFIALCSGCQLFNVDENLRLEPENLVNFIKVNKIDISFLPPAILRVIAIESLKNLKILLTGGELVDKKYVEQFAQFGKYYNSYGLTETAIASTYFEYNALDELRYSVPIGKPVEGTYVYVLDNDLNLVPKGINGEIVIGGLNPSDGYLDIEPNEKPKFLKDPFRKGCHIFLTGDIGRWDNYDNLIITGRADNQVKINGYRVELSEIEYQLRNLSFVSDARALINIRDGVKQLVAALETDKELSLNDINTVLRVELPHFMVPKEYYIYKTFPVNKNGKTNLEEIKKLNAVRLIDTTFTVELTVTQQILHENWCRVLKLNAISIDSSFFDIGGDSLLAVTCVGAINDKIHRRISVRDLYNC
ncbi:MAG TPA: hypothetical protein DEG63_09885, partial [Flavobacteriaceae bacterium]|nr:hypothetical protein [Flavobacteriaceae bacterium]